MTPTSKPRRLLLAGALTVLFCAGPAAAQTATLIERPTQAASQLPLGPLGYSPAHMDRTVSPRVDFYAYATGNWLKSLKIPDSEIDISGFSMVKATIKHQLLSLTLNASTASAPKGSPEQQVGDYYRAAMNTARLDQLGLAPLKPALDAASAAATPADLGRIVAQQVIAGAGPLLIAWPTVDARQNSRRVLLLLPLGTQLEQNQYTDAPSQRIRDLYVAYITRMLQQTGESAAQAAAHAKTILAMEAALSAPRLNPLDARDPALTYNIMTVAQAQALVPAIDLSEMLAQLGMKDVDRLQVKDIEGVKAVNRVLKSHSREDAQVLLRWFALHTSASLLGQPWSGMADEYQRQRDQLVRVQPREEKVVSDIAMQLFHPISRLYINTYFSESTRRDITTMMGHIRQEFETRLRANPWLDEATRAKALEKLSRVDIQVGYPKDADWIDFSGIDIRPDDHFGNNQRIARFMFERERTRLSQPATPDRFSTPPWTTPIAVNAGYSPTFNGIDISAGILQPPFYTPAGDQAVNYCTVGAVIGHELTHGFDSNGRLYDAVGNVNDWWTPAASAEFGKRTQLLVDQFDQYKVLPDLKQSGNLTLTENTADLGGIALAHAALNRALKGKQTPKVDGLTTDQRCFVAWAQLWTYKGRTERIRFLAATDFHAIGFLRGFGPLRNLDAFHKAFATRPGDPMWLAPDRRARIW
jgi:putative endopeptidase